MARRAPVALLLLVVALLAALAGPAAAYPQLWVSYQIDDDKLVADAPATCTGHPDDGEGSHASEPVADADMVFEASPATAVCPGEDVAVTVSFPQPRFLLATSSAGALRGPTPSTLPAAVVQRTCPNRWVHGKPGGQTGRLDKVPLMLTVPCGQTEAIELDVTSATGSTSAFLQGSTSVPVATAGCKPCAPAAGAAKAGNATAAPAAAAAAAPAAAAAAKSGAGRGLTAAVAAAAAAVAVAVAVAGVV